MAPPGTYSQLSPRIIETFCLALKRSLYLETAAACVGVTLRTIQSWKKQGRENPDTVYGEFLRAVEKTLAEVETQHVQAMVVESELNWLCRAWLLERRFPQRWSSDRKRIRELEQRLKDIEKEQQNGRS